MQGPFWRVFPWDATATPGEPFTAEYRLPAGIQTGGRFDLPSTSSLYLAIEEPIHALVEVLQIVRGKGYVSPSDLVKPTGDAPRRFHPLALVETWVADEVFAALPDLGDPAQLQRFGVRPDELSSRNRTVTQRIAGKLHTEFGLPGFRWWSAFSGDWHVAVLFLDRVAAGQIEFGTPDPLHLTHPVVAAAAAELKLQVTAR